MLIGDKGESGGRRWGGGRICPRGIFGQSQGQMLGCQIYGFRSFDQSQGPSLGGGKFCLKGIFYQSQGPSLGTPFLPSGHFWSSPKVRRWVFHLAESAVWNRSLP